MRGQEQNHAACRWGSKERQHEVWKKTSNKQWHNRGGGRVPPRDFWLGNFCWPTRKKKARKKGKRGKNWEEKKENCKREGEKLKVEGGKVRKWGEDPFFFCFSHFKTTNLFWVYQNGNFLPGKSISRRENRKNDFTPSKKFSFYTSANKNSASLASSPKVKVMRGSCWGKHVLHF